MYHQEAQGFTPSPSRSRLAYDFRDRSPLKETPISPSPGSEQIRDKRNFTKEIPQRQLEEKSQMEPPKIVSVHSKSNVILDQTRNDNFEIKKVIKVIQLIFYSGLNNITRKY